MSINRKIFLGVGAILVLCVFFVKVRTKDMSSDSLVSTHKIAIENSGETPTEQLTREKVEMDELLNRAILQPTLENVKAYRVAEQKLAERAFKFKRACERVAAHASALALKQVSPQIKQTLDAINKIMKEANIAEMPINSSTTKVVTPNVRTNFKPLHSDLKNTGEQ